MKEAIINFVYQEYEYPNYWEKQNKFNCLPKKHTLKANKFALSMADICMIIDKVSGYQPSMENLGWLMINNPALVEKFCIFKWVVSLHVNDKKAKKYPGLKIMNPDMEDFNMLIRELEGRSTFHYKYFIKELKEALACVFYNAIFYTELQKLITPELSEVEKYDILLQNLLNHYNDGHRDYSRRLNTKKLIANIKILAELTYQFFTAHSVEKEFIHKILTLYSRKDKEENLADYIQNYDLFCAVIKSNLKDVLEYDNEFRKRTPSGYSPLSHSLMNIIAYTRSIELYKFLFSVEFNIHFTNEKFYKMLIEPAIGESRGYEFGKWLFKNTYLLELVDKTALLELTSWKNLKLFICLIEEFGLSPNLSVVRYSTFESVSYFSLLIRTVFYVNKHSETFKYMLCLPDIDLDKEFGDPPQHTLNLLISEKSKALYHRAKAQQNNWREVRDWIHLVWMASEDRLGEPVIISPRIEIAAGQGVQDEANILAGSQTPKSDSFVARLEAERVLLAGKEREPSF
jgi:hypothetical protein